MPAWIYRTAMVLGIMLLLALQYRFWVGEGSFAHIHALKKEIAQIQSENERLRARNEALQAKIDDLKSGDEAIEASARHDLGLIKQGEKFYRLPEVDEQDSAHDRTILEGDL